MNEYTRHSPIFIEHPETIDDPGFTNDKIPKNTKLYLTIEDAYDRCLVRSYDSDPEAALVIGELYRLNVFVRSSILQAIQLNIVLELNEVSGPNDKFQILDKDDFTPTILPADKRTIIDAFTLVAREEITPRGKGIKEDELKILKCWTVYHGVCAPVRVSVASLTHSTTSIYQQPALI